MMACRLWFDDAQGIYLRVRFTDSPRPVWYSVTEKKNPALDLAIERLDEDRAKEYEKLHQQGLTLKKV